MACLQGPQGEVRQGTGREQGRTWGSRLYEGPGWSALVFPANTSLVKVLVSFVGVRLRDALGKALGGGGDYLSPAWLRESHEELALTCGPASYCLGPSSGLVSKAPQATWPHRMDAKAAILESSLVKLSTRRLLKGD